MQRYCRIESLLQTILKLVKATLILGLWIASAIQSLVQVADTVCHRSPRRRHNPSFPNERRLRLRGRHLAVPISPVRPSGVTFFEILGIDGCPHLLYGAAAEFVWGHPSGGAKNRRHHRENRL